MGAAVTTRQAVVNAVSPNSLQENFAAIYDHEARTHLQLESSRVLAMATLSDEHKA